MFLFYFQIAAQNCRKRKASQLSCLEEHLRQERSRKEEILSERVKLLWRQQELARGLDRLERDIVITMKQDEDWMISFDQNMIVSVIQNCLV